MIDLNCKKCTRTANLLSLCEDCRKKAIGHVPKPSKFVEPGIENGHYDSEGRYYNPDTYPEDVN